MKFMMSTLLVLLTFAFFVFCMAFLTGCSTSKTHSDYGIETSNQIDTQKQQTPAEKKALRQEQEKRKHLRLEANRKARERVLEMQRQQREKSNEIAKQRLKDAHAVASKLERMRAPDRTIPAITKSLKRSLNNPDSFQHIKTTITPIRHKNTYYVLVRVHYRATNAYGGLIKTSSEFRYNTKGHFISAE